jgi:predicted nucleic acid-binding protein
LAAAKAELVRPGGEIVVPSRFRVGVFHVDVFHVDVAAALVRQANKDQLRCNNIKPAPKRFLTRSPNSSSGSAQPILTRWPVLASALALGHKVKDCIYLAPAIKLNWELLTSDKRLASKAQRVWPKIRVLEGRHD